MTSTYNRGGRVRPWVLLACVAVPLLRAQSLEDKVAEAKRMQAASMLDADPATVDSLVRAHGNAARAVGPNPQSPRATGRVPPDSLIQGPIERDSAKAGKGDGSGPERDSLARVPVPKRYEQRIFQNAPASVFGTPHSAGGRDYPLGPGDVITVSLWGDKEKEYELALNPDGKVFLEGVGLVPLAGKTVEDARKELTGRLGRIYSGIGRGTTHVDVSLGKTGPIKVFVLGEVKLPGGYTFSGNTSVMSAMYHAHGPTDIGTVRNLQLTRGGHKYDLDLYRYLIKGESLRPDVLQDGDILFAGRAEILCEIEGDVGRPATYELKRGEGIKELLEFAGRLNPTAAPQRMTLQRVFPDGKRDYLDLPPPQDFLSGKAKVELRDGDRILVERSTEPSRNFVTLSGPVKYPGTFAFHPGLSIPGLIREAGGLREDAFLGRVHVVRFLPDGSSQLFAYSLDTARIDTIGLEPRDNIILYSTKEMFRPDSVQIAGAVAKPGKYEFSQGMTVKDLVMRAGGYLPHHERGKVLVDRGDPHERKVSHVVLQEEDGLAKSGSSFSLRPDDLVHVPIDPTYYKKEIVTLDGLFLRPGKYALLYPGERLASVIDRAGGFKDGAYVNGGRLYRTRNNVGRVGIDLDRALDNPRGRANIPMVGGDSVFVPEKLNTVKVVGDVGFETSVLYEKGAPVQYYIDRAGGFTRTSDQDRVVVEYANGETTNNGYFIRRPDAGSVIYVPKGPEPKPIDWLSGTNAILATTATALTIILAVSQLRK